MANIKDMKPDTVYRVTKGNTDGGIQVGDLISFESKVLIIWAGKDTGAYDKTDLEDPKITDFEFEAANDYQIVKSRWSIKCCRKMS